MSIVLQGSTSGSCTLQEQAVAGNTVLTLPTTSGTILTDTSPKAGNVIQVVNATYSTATVRSSSTFADTGLTASITPTFSTSKILVLINQVGCGKDTGDAALQLRLIRNSTTLAFLEDIAAQTSTSATNNIGSCSMSYLDSPATTSSVTYKTQLASISNNARVYVQAASANNTTSTITLLEIAA